MAIAGGSCSAYRCFWEIADGGEGRLVATPTTTTRALCVEVDEAMRRLRTGELAIVAGGDMADLRERLNERGQP